MLEQISSNSVHLVQTALIKLLLNKEFDQCLHCCHPADLELLNRKQSVSHE